MVDFGDALAKTIQFKELDAALSAASFDTGTLLERVNAYGQSQSGKPYTLLMHPLTTNLDQPAIEYKLSDDQQVAWEKIQKWATNDKPHFVLRGHAGTGKSFLMQKLRELKTTVIYSATTNKAAKVLGKSVDTLARTTYSVLGLRMEQVEDQLVLTPSPNPPYFSRHTILVIDEASMVGSSLFQAIEKARARYSIKIMYVGDPAQLPPVGELRSPAWKCTDDPECRAMLKQVMRHDNQILALATDLRTCIAEKDWNTPIVSNHSTDEGIWKWRGADQFEGHLLDHIPTYDLRETKVIAWRNKTVDRYNTIIRRKLGFIEPYCVGDIILLAEPIEREGKLIAHTDDDFVIKKLSDDSIDIGDDNIPTWQMHVKGDQTLVLQVPQDQGNLDAILGHKAREARAAKGFDRKKAWDEFWNTKKKFQRIRYGYALTAHRAQGSSYKIVYVDQSDILANQNEREAYRCLYVAATRASKQVHSF